MWRKEEWKPRSAFCVTHVRRGHRDDRLKQQPCKIFIHISWNKHTSRHESVHSNMLDKECVQGKPFVTL